MPPLLLLLSSMAMGLDHVSAADTSVPRKRKPPVFNDASRHTGRNHRILGIDEDVNIESMICLVSAQVSLSVVAAVGQGRRLRLLVAGPLAL